MSENGDTKKKKSISDKEEVDQELSSERMTPVKETDNPSFLRTVLISVLEILALRIHLSPRQPA